MIDVNMVDAVKVQFLVPFDEEDFVERGMKAWLTGIEFDSENNSYTLFFDFTDFETENEKYFREIYYPNNNTPDIKRPRQMFTAIEAGYYTRKLMCRFWLSTNKRDDKLFETEVTKHIVPCAVQ